MIESVGFDYYQNVFLGSEITSRKDFDRLQRRAAAYIERITFGRIETMTESVKCAVCNVCEVLKRRSARSGIKSEQNDGYSVTYKDSFQSESDNLYLAASVFVPSELLYRGI